MTSYYRTESDTVNFRLADLLYLRRFNPGTYEYSFEELPVVSSCPATYTAPCRYYTGTQWSIVLPGTVTDRKVLIAERFMQDGTATLTGHKVIAADIWEDGAWSSGLLSDIDPAHFHWTVTTAPDDYDPYYYAFGIDRLEVPASCPVLTAMWERITLRINEAYYDRFLAGETLEQWQRHAQVLTDRIALRYERALRMYAQAVTEESYLPEQVTTYNGLRDTSSSTGRTRAVDTPDTSVNEAVAFAYAGSVGDSKSSNENVRSGSVTTVMKGVNAVVTALNENVDEWRDLETDIVDEYAKVFLSLIWY